MGSKRSTSAPGAMLRVLVSLAALNLCWLCLAPITRADWGKIYCETTADSMDVATINSAIDAYKTDLTRNGARLCCQNNGFASHCTTFWTLDSVNFYICGALKCDDCSWVSDMWIQVAENCTQNYGGVDRVAGYVSYDWLPGMWNKYGI